MNQRLAFIDTARTLTAQDIATVEDADRYLEQLQRRAQAIQGQIDTTPNGEHRQKQLVALYYRRLACTQVEERRALLATAA